MTLILDFKKAKQTELVTRPDGARALLKLMPPDQHTVSKIKQVCADLAKSPQLSGSSSGSPQQALDSLFFVDSSSETLYNLEVCYSLLLPSMTSQVEKNFDFQLSMAKARGVPSFLGMLTRSGH